MNILMKKGTQRPIQSIQEVDNKCLKAKNKNKKGTKNLSKPHQEPNQSKKLIKGIGPST